MYEPRNPGRIAGTLLLLQMAGGITANFVLIAPIVAPPGFLVNAAAHPLNASLAALAGLATAAFALGVAITASQVIRRQGEAWATWLLALAVAAFALAAVEQTTLLSLLSLSQAYASAAVPDEALFQALRGVVAAARNWSHYVHLLLDGGVFLVLFGAALRFALLPRVLAGLGMLAALLQMSTIARPIFGHPVVFPLLAPLGVVLLATAVWLLFRGFRQSAPAAVPAG